MPDARLRRTRERYFQPPSATVHRMAHDIRVDRMVCLDCGRSERQIEASGTSVCQPWQAVDAQFERLRRLARAYD